MAGLARRLRGPAVLAAALGLITWASGWSPTGSLPTARAASSPQPDPYSPSYGAPYRHGAMPTVAALARMKAWDATHEVHAAGTAFQTLTYGGGTNGQAVVSGTPRVYLVFWGTQWGTATTDGSRIVHLSKDPSGAAPYLQKFFRGIGTGGEQWSGTMTQYCDGPLVPQGASSCPPAAARVGYPTGGALAGVWYDNSGAEPANASSTALAEEAVAAASHFGNTTPASNRYAQYFILSAHGQTPDGWQPTASNNGNSDGEFCAWHDFSTDPQLGGGPAAGGGPVPSPYGPVAFTDLPYQSDAGSTCGTHFVNPNSNGILDGFSIVAGHEYAETLTNEYPWGGWWNPANPDYPEVADECEWIGDGPGSAADLSLTTGTFAVQTNWSNDDGACDLLHPTVLAAGDFSVAANPASGFTNIGGSVSTVVSTSVVSGGSQGITLTVSGLPPGATAVLSPTLVSVGQTSTLSVTTSGATPAGTYTVTITATGAVDTHTATLTLAVYPGSLGFVNGSFATGDLTGWTSSGAVSVTAGAGPAGGYAAVAGAPAPTRGDSTLSQTFTVPSAEDQLGFWYDDICPDSVAFSWATATLVDNTTSSSVTVLPRTCVRNSGWVPVVTPVTAYHNYTLTLTSHGDGYPTTPVRTLFGGVALANVARGPNQIVNGGFETGTLTGWTLSGASVADESSVAHSGSDGLRLGAATPTSGDSSVEQTFTAASGDSQVSFWYQMSCPDSVTYDWATASLVDNTTGTSVVILPRTCTSGGGWIPVSGAVVAGHIYTLTLTSHDDGYPGEASYVYFDDVTTY